VFSANHDGVDYAAIALSISLLYQSIS
jgi:hypothetical protein